MSRMADERSKGSSQTLSAEQTEPMATVVSYPWQCQVTGLVDWSKKAHSLLESLSLEKSKDVEIDLDAFEADSDQPDHPESVSGTRAFSVASSSKGLQSFEISDAYQNAVQDNPHARSLERILKRFKGSEFQSDSPNVIPEELLRVSAEDVIITVMLCDQKGCKEQEYDVLASQTLHDIKDALYFVGDWMFDGLRRRSGCMFIDGAFYSDMRQPAVDYAKDLVKWIERAGHPKLKQEPFRTMEARLCDLEMIPFGEKCCYIRQGDIEHLMYFTGARLFNKAVDCPLREAYPCLIWMRKYRRQRCLVCQRLLAAWVVLDSSRCPFNPAYFCRICFKHFSQDEQGRSIPPVDYKVFPYLHEET